MEGQIALIVRGTQEIFESLNICLKKYIRKFLKLIRRYKEVLTEVALWSTGRQLQKHPKAMPLLWIEVGRCTCLATLAWGVAGLDEIPRKAGASFAGARTLAFLFGLC